jgi:hypothetical protein
MAVPSASNPNPCGLPSSDPGGTQLSTWLATYESVAQMAIGAPQSWSSINNPTQSMTLNEWQCAVQAGMQVGDWDDEQLADAEAGYNEVTSCWPCSGQIPTAGSTYTGACVPGVPGYPNCGGVAPPPLDPTLAARYLSIIQAHPTDPALQNSFAPYTYAEILAAAAQYSATPTGAANPGGYPAPGSSGGIVGVIAPPNTPGPVSTQPISQPAPAPAPAPSPVTVVGSPAPTPAPSPAPTTAPTTTTTAPTTTTTASSGLSSDLSSLVSDLTANPIYLIGGAILLVLLLGRK